MRKERHLLHERGAVDPFVRGQVDLQVVTRVLEDVGFGDFFLKFGDGSVLLLRFQKVPQVINLVGQFVVGNLIEAVSKDEPHAESEDQLSGGKYQQIPECQPQADGQSLHEKDFVRSM